MASARTTKRRSVGGTPAAESLSAQPPRPTTHSAARTPESHSHGTSQMRPPLARFPRIRPRVEPQYRPSREGLRVGGSTCSDPFVARQIETRDGPLGHKKRTPYPLITATGRSFTTLFEMPASWHVSTTLVTSL